MVRDPAGEDAPREPGSPGETGFADRRVPWTTVSTNDGSTARLWSSGPAAAVSWGSGAAALGASPTIV